ncbi:Protoheme IX farnesyltransferase,mitochondrial [Taphrina deformans PYCC 5710]|uniref:Protoheme IX farnesyltransferase, mitochondrial n=1 Tax=Taphrina deformans (strain PYCC 5710 / ATCC 11124 / CBS 356.35 / IMI 108563 / JCM 9778 / NBRC 8474) TaxID=1097556 RepID=R4XEZ9_TAPDE|nr:Protoheme IX farnesyltransferase,mitochondrial [Taphrina deformans PYCC 5710]|eukprot:CCG83046.1 Protoheme IX farnesyltransferase,mitochondrial [Taphrina deformans PYCC 5710]
MQFYRTTTTLAKNDAFTPVKRNPAPTYKTYLELSKPKLSTLVVLTTMSSYALSPFPAASLPTLFFLTSGTWLCCASANAYNMWLEPPFDSQMTRTRNRPLVRGALHPNQAFSFASAAGLLGSTALFLGVNPVCSALGLANIVLYAGIYTPLKRVSITNTWVGAIVGAIPPLMGWAAATPYPILCSENLGGLYLALLLYAWQFPHFNSLAWYIRSEYARAGYVMTSITNPGMNARVSLRYSVAMFPLCYGLVHVGVCDHWFLYDSALLNAYMSYQAFVFWRCRGTNKEKDKKAKKLFFSSLLYLPGVLLLAMLHKTGLWNDLVQQA